MVGQLADLAVVLALAQVVHQPRGCHDGLGLENRCRAGDPGQRVQGLRDGMNLWLVLAVRPEPLPQERDGVQPQHLDAGVGEEEDDVGVLREHVGIGPVEVPLPLVERRPDPALQVVVPGEVAGREVGEHLRQSCLVRVRHRAVGKDVEVRPLRHVTGPRVDGPTVLARDVVEHQVEYEADPLSAKGSAERAQVLHRAEVRADGAVVSDRIATVVVPVPRQQQRHEVQVGDAELLEVRAPGRAPPRGRRRTGRHRPRSRASGVTGTSPAAEYGAGPAASRSASRSA